MRASLRAIAALLLVAPLCASADTTYTYPKVSPALSIAFPEDWSVEAGEGAELTAKSPDEEIEINLWPVKTDSDPKKMVKELEETGKEIGEDIKEFVSDFKLTEKKQGNINGIEAAMFGGVGKSKEEEGKDVTVEVTFLAPDDKHLFGLMYWGSEGGEKANAASLEKIVHSIKKP